MHCSGLFFFRVIVSTSTSFGLSQRFGGRPGSGRDIKFCLPLSLANAYNRNSLVWNPFELDAA